jgi:hypothetical protein
LRNQPKPQPRETAKNRELLNRTVAWYHQSFLDDPKGKQALATLGLTDTEIFLDFKVGYANNTVLKTISEGSELQQGLKALGLLDSQGQETFHGCLVFPWFDESENCLGLWGLEVSSGKGKTLPGARGVWNWQAAKRSRSVIVTDSILSAMQLYQAGFKEVIPAWGQGITDDHLRLFQRYGTKEVYLTVESRSVMEKLREEEVKVYPVKLPTLPVEPAAVQEALKKAHPETRLESEVLKKLETSGYEKRETGFTIQYGTRRYEVKGIEKGEVRLKVTVKAYRRDEPKRFYLDSVDLYSHRGRMLFAKGACGYFGEKEELIEADLGKLIELAESFEPLGQETRKAPLMSKAEEGEALSFLKDPKLLTRILKDFETCGYTGEEANKLMGYLAAVSRKLPDPLSVLIQSRSAAGKSTLQDAILQFVPREDYEKYTRLTGQALFYKDENGLVHKLLAVEEEAGAREASYSIRNLQSAKALSIATTGKDPATGKLRTTEYQVKGPVAMMLTTTSVDMDYETQNRFITLTIDESKEMTERILTNQRALETLEGLTKRQGQEDIVKLHQNAQRLLKPLAVVNPYAPKLTFPSESLRARRDHKKYLGIIKVIAFLHQYQRQVKTYGEGQEAVAYVEVTVADIEKANKLAGEVLGRTLDELSAPSRALLLVIREMVKKKSKELGLGSQECRFTRRGIREFSGWSDFQVKTHIGELAELEYIYSVAGMKGKEYVYELTAPEGGEDGKPFLAGLAKVEALA